VASLISSSVLAVVLWAFPRAQLLVKDLAFTVTLALLAAVIWFCPLIQYPRMRYAIALLFFLVATPTAYWKVAEYEDAPRLASAGTVNPAAPMVPPTQQPGPTLQRAADLRAQQQIQQQIQQNEAKCGPIPRDGQVAVVNSANGSTFVDNSFSGLKYSLINTKCAKNTLVKGNQFRR